MPKVTYIQPDGSTRAIDAPAGTTVMEAAIDNDVPGIVAECGGACSCATCHVYVESGWFEKIPPAEPQEEGMLECALERRENSRLSCQITLDDSLDGIVVHVPEAQV
jgi:ferredoxin, 2Fe-2S